ncbi:MAG: hypothetical protein WD794_06045 [Mycobacteriales bacterium]
MTRPRRIAHGSDDGSVVLALLASLMVGSLVLVITATAIGGQRVVRFDRDFSAVIAAADAGVQDALHRLNSGRDPISPMPALASTQPNVVTCQAPLPTSQKCITGTAGVARYQWYAVKVLGREWDVHSRGERNGRVRTVVARLLENREFFASAFADTEIFFTGGNVADSYSSGAPGPAIYTPRAGRLGVLGSNGPLKVPNSTIMDGAQLWNFAPTPAGYTGPLPAPSDDLNTRCPNTPTIGLTMPPQYPASSYSPAIDPDVADPPGSLSACSSEATLRPSSGQAYQERIANRRVMSPSPDELQARTTDCVAAAGGSFTSIPSFKSSTTATLAPATAAPPPAGLVRVPPKTVNGTTTPGYYCFRNTGSGPSAVAVDFDASFSVSGASGSDPVVIVALGNVKVIGGGSRTINCEACDTGGKASKTPAAAALRIYIAPTPSGTIGTFDASSNKFMSFALSAPLSDCTGGSQNEVYGSLICKRLQTQGGWNFHYDVALAAIGNNTFTIQRYEERR